MAGCTACGGRRAQEAPHERAGRAPSGTLAGLDALKAWREHKGVRKLKGLVWPGKGGKMAAHGHDAGWSRIRDDETSGMRRDVRFHDLRHTCASHLVSGSWGRAWRLEEVCAVLGHKDLKTTQRYAHLSPESIMGAAEQAREQWVPDGYQARTEPGNKAPNPAAHLLPKP